jgi:hypothetical protein
VDDNLIPDHMRLQISLYIQVPSFDKVGMESQAFKKPSGAVMFLIIKGMPSLLVDLCLLIGKVL